MARDKGLLSDLQLRHWIKAGKPLAKADGDGLTFTLSAAGVAGWMLQPHQPYRPTLVAGKDVHLAAGERALSNGSLSRASVRVEKGATITSSVVRGRAVAVLFPYEVVAEATSPTERVTVP